MIQKEIHIADFDYPLDDARIAKFPLKNRDESKLLVYDRGRISTSVFSKLCTHLSKGSLLVFNNTRVIHARLLFRKASGAVIEIFLLEPSSPADYEQSFHSRGSCEWTCLVGNLKKWKKEPLIMEFQSGNETFSLAAVYKGEHGTSHIVDFTWDNPHLSWAEVLDIVGELPIPPYLHRSVEESDKTTYQTVYSKIKGSVAAPTAGLHFTKKVLQDIEDCGIDHEEVTLHVGAGTFRPVKSEEIHSHEMHSEYIVVNRKTIEKLLLHNTKATTVGTTTVRTLESLYYIGLKLHRDPDLTEEELCVGQWEPYEVEESLSVAEALEEVLSFLDRNHLEALHTNTQIIIVPGYKYKIIDTLITNFHQPKSTLLLLVGAFIGDDWRKVYDYALENDYRFLSYGDACLFIPKC